MQDLPAKFGKFYRRSSVEQHWIVKIADGPLADSGTTIRLFSDIDMNLSDGHVYPLLDGGVEFEKAVDPFGRSYTTAEISLALKNGPYTHDHKRLSDFDLLSDAELTVYIYACAGPGLTVAALSDCLGPVFKGTVVGEPSYDAEILVLRVADIGVKIEDINLPLTLLDDADSGHPYGDRRLSIALGDLTGANDFGDGKQLVQCRGRDSSGIVEFFVADHEVAAVDALWIYLDSVDAWLKLDQTAMSITTGTEVGDDGITRTKVSFSASELLTGWLYLRPSGIDISEWYPEGLGTGAAYNDGRNNVVNEAKAWDADQGSYCELSSCENKQRALLTFKWPDYDIIRRKPTILDLVQPITWRPDPNTRIIVPPLDAYKDLTAWAITGDDVYLLWKSQKNSNLTFDWTDPYDAADPGTQVLAYAHGEAIYWNTNDSTSHNGTFKSLQLNEAVGVPGETFENQVAWKMETKNFLVHFLCKLSVDADAWVLRVNEVCLRMHVTTDIYLNEDSVLYAEVEGLTIGTAIDSRLGSASDPTDLARSAGHQIERILRLYFGFSGDIDFVRIDESVITSLYSRAILAETESLSLGRLMQEISENSNIIAFIDERSRLSVIDLLGAPGTPTIIPMTDLIAPPQVFRTDQKYLTNYMKLSYDYDHDSHKFAYEIPIQNASSQAIHGLIERAVRCRMLTPASVSVYSIITMTGSETVTPFLSVRHNGIVLRTLGWRYLHLDFGDEISLDPTSVDPHLLFNGASWSGEQFVIIGKRIVDRDAVEITAIQLT